MIWTWNGHAIQFITDVLGVAPLGASDGEGTYFPVDHDEYVSIPGAALAAVDGHYDIRVTEELSEVSYLDQIQLYGGGPSGGHRDFHQREVQGAAVSRIQAVWRERGASIRSRRGMTTGTMCCRGCWRATRSIRTSFRGRNWAWQSRIRWSWISGRRLRTGRAVLLLNGWVDWPDGSTFRAAAQEVKGGLVMPYLQMQDAAGQWKTVNADMGMPAGKPKTIAVELRFSRPAASCGS